MRWFLVLALALAAPAAQARSESKTLQFARDQVWPTAVRFIAVDLGAKILDRDPDAGYVLFEVRDEGKVYRGSLEVLPVKSDSGSQVRFVISLVDRPSWMEIAMITRLLDKVRVELGSPNPPKKPAPPPSEPPKDDKDKPKDKDKDKKPPFNEDGSTNP